MREFLYVRVAGGTPQIGVNAGLLLGLIYEDAVTRRRFQAALAMTAQTVAVAKGSFPSLRVRSVRACQGKEENQAQRMMAQV